MGPTLWNIFYDRVLQLDVSKEKQEFSELNFTMGVSEIKTREKQKHLGVIFNKNLEITGHVKYLTEKTLYISKQLNILISSTTGPSSKRKLLVTVIRSAVLYAASIWADILGYCKFRTILQQIQRLVLIRTCRTYRPTSNDALYVIAGIPPMHLLVEERKKIYQNVTAEKQYLKTENK